MKPLLAVLETINGQVDKYRTLELKLVKEQGEILRVLAYCDYDLRQHKIDARGSWMRAYIKSDGSNAKKEREADFEVPEYDLINDNLKAVENLMDCIRSNMSANK